jgi:hypothetical protein
MPAAAFNVGRDVTLTIFTTAGTVETDNLKNFNAKQLTSDVKVVLITGIMLPAYLPEGWEGNFDFVRTDSSIDDYFAALEAGYYSGQDLPTGTITETITNVDGSISEYQFQNVAMRLADAGSWSGNKDVELKVEFIASTRVKIA